MVNLCGISDMIMWLPVITDILVPTGSSWLLWFIAKWAFQQVVSILKSRCLTTTKSPHTEDCSDSQWKSFWTSIKHPSFKNNLFKGKFLEGISTRRGRLYIFLHLWAINVKIEELYCPELEHQISAVVASVLLMQADTNLYMRQNWQFHSLNKFVIRIIRQAGVCI